MAVRYISAFFYFSVGTMNENDMQHGIDYAGQDITEFIATEKFNGCRAYWDGFNMWTRGSFRVALPDSWRAVLPTGVSLDGEVYDGVDGFYRSVSAVRYGHFTPFIKFMIFDSPSCPGEYVDRLTHAKEYETGPLVVAPFWRIKNFKDALNYLKEIIARGGEGLMLRHKSLSYSAGRTKLMMKLKEGMVNQK
jgi:DNA ligase-1